MATTNLITNITKSGDYPISVTCSATNNCGLLSLMLPTQWTEQMLYELPTLNIKIFMSDGTQLVSFDVDMSTVNRDTLAQSEPYSIPIYNLPSDFTFSITPLFDKYALQAHNDQIDTGDFGSFTTSETGIVDTNIKDYSSLYWTTPTQTFNISIDFDDSNIVAGGGSGGGGGGGSITIDTQVNGTSTNAVQNKAIYNFVNSSVATNTANFIDTFNSVEELEAYTGTVTNNDYAFVIGTDSEGNTVYNRYKYNGSEWAFEYTLNNSSFTAAQWATIQSGLTASDKTKLDGIEPGANKTVVDENLSATSTNPVQNKAVNTALAAKQDTITDLTNIRSGATSGSTAVQPADMSAALAVKQDKLTFDSTPTESSTNPVTSGGVWTDQQRQETEIGVVTNAGAKNLLKITESSQTKNGVTFSVNSDGSVFLNGTATSGTTFALNDQMGLQHGQYILSGIVPHNVYLTARSTSSTNYSVTQNNSETRIDDDINYVYIYVASGTTLDNAVIKPMIRPASITDSAFVPYAKTNRELTVAQDEDRAALIAQVDGGAKNLLKITAASQTINGVTFTINDNQTVTCNGTASETVSFDIRIPTTVSGKTYFVSGCPIGGATEKTYRQLIRDVTNQKNLGSDIGDGLEVKFPNPTENVVLRINIFAGYTANNLTFKPMLCTVADYKISPAYVPHRPSWQEMYDMIKALQNGA